MNSHDSDSRFDSVILLALFALALFGSPLMILWSGPGLPWYWVYLWWLIVILVGALIQIRRSRNES